MINQLSIKTMKKKYILLALIIGNFAYMPAFANGWGKNKRSDKVESLSISPTLNVNNASKSLCTQTTFDDFLKPATCYQSNQVISASEAIHLKSFRQLMTLAGSGQDIGSFISDHLATLASKNTNQYINNGIQKIPFFAQTNLNLDFSSQSSSSLSLDSFMNLRSESDESGYLNNILFSQARIAANTGSDTTTNFGLGYRAIADKDKLVGINGFWDYRIVEYGPSHSRWGIGAELGWKDFLITNNWYIAGTGVHSVTIDGSQYDERVVPGWDVELAYRLPSNPNISIGLKAYRWDYKKTNDVDGVEGSLSWQATPHLAIKTWATTSIAAYPTIENTYLDDDNLRVGIGFTWSQTPVTFKKRDYRRNLSTQMTQPVKRTYEVLLERYSSGSGFINRASG